MQVLARRWRSGRRELDLVALEGDVVVFIEVKTRSGPAFGGALGAVRLEKQRAVTMAAAAFLQEKGWTSRRCRFDVVGIEGAQEPRRVRHLRGAFDATE